MKALRWLVLAGVLAAAPAAVAAEEGDSHGGGHHGVDAKTLALQLLNFGALLFILIKFAGPAVNKALRSRHEQLKTDIDEAARLRAVAEERFKTHEKRLANLEQEIATMTAAIKRDGEQEQGRIVAAAEEKARRIQAETTFQLEQQVKEAEISFRREVAKAAVKVAEELLRKSVSAGDEQRLAQGFVTELASSKSTAHDAGKPAPPASPHEEVTG